MAAPHPIVVDPAHPLVERVRALCMRYPGAVEAPAWGRPTFRAGTRMFALVGSSMERPFTVTVKIDPEDLTAVDQDARFFSPPYWGARGWRSLDLDAADLDWTLVAELLDASYRQVATARQLAALDAHPIVPASGRGDAAD